MEEEKSDLLFLLHMISLLKGTALLKSLCQHENWNMEHLTEVVSQKSSDVKNLPNQARGATCCGDRGDRL